MLHLLGLLLVGAITLVEGHGRLLVPPARTSMWRDGFPTVKNYVDHELNCGGFYNHWHTQEGKCGVCGDPWQGPREGEAGGIYAKGIITRTYQQGQVIDVKIQITANHKGWHSFYLCPHNNPKTPVTEECFKKYILADQTGQTKFPMPTDAEIINLKLSLPKDVTCTQCVLRWKWVCGNRWGCDESKKCCVGCGLKQEHFYGCSDITIVPANNSNTTSSAPTRAPAPTTAPVPTTAPTPTTAPVPTTSPTNPTGVTLSTPKAGNNAWLRCPGTVRCTPVATATGTTCTLNCASKFCPIVPCRCTCPGDRSPTFY